MGHARNGLAIVVCTIAVILPGLLLGAAAAFIYRFFVSREIGPEPDFFMMRWLFGFDAPGQIIKWIFYIGIPGGIHGGIAGAVAIAITAKLFKSVDMNIAAWATGAIYTVLFILIVVVAIVAEFIDVTILEAGAQIVGIWIGLIGAAQAAPRPQAIAQKVPAE